MKPLNELALVAHMNAAFGNPAGKSTDYAIAPMRVMPPIPRDPAAWKRIERQLANIGDEINELMVAFQTGNVNAVRDALCDIRVFALGGLTFLGFTEKDQNEYPISDDAPVTRLLKTISPVIAMKAIHQYLMASVMKFEFQDTVIRTRVIIWLAHTISAEIGLSEVQQDEDMEAVINGVMTRFVKDDADLEATLAIHRAKGVLTFYTEGDYPTMILKSDGDYPDAPKGKFLKSASYKDTVFAQLDNEPFVKAMIALHA